MEGGSDIATHVRDAKAALLADDGVLELVPSEAGDLEQVGGMEKLKDWLRIRGRGFEPAAQDFGLEAPRGVLLAGVPGCGKSLIAKTLARTWHMPLVRLEPGAIFGPYVGESEERLRDGARTVEAMAPVVVWIDEIEKGFAAGDGGRRRGQPADRRGAPPMDAGAPRRGVPGRHLQRRRKPPARAPASRALR